MLTLFRGDDMAFAEFDRKVCVRFNTCQDLTGWAAKFCLYDNIKQTADISSRIWTFGYTSTETQVFPLGKTFGRLLVVDPTGQVRQISKVEVEVVNQKLEPCLAGFIAISVDNVLADYNNMGNKPVLNDKVISGIHDSAYYGLADAEKVKELEEKIDSIVDHGAEIEELSENLATETLQRIEADERLSSRMTNIINGAAPINKLLFEAEGDTENFYRIQVIMRDDGTGKLLPALALDAVPREDSSDS